MMIEIDFDVFKAITARRPSEQMSENDVLRDLLNLPRNARNPFGGAKGPDAAAGAGLGEGNAWMCKSVRFPVGARLRAKYQGKTVYAEVGAGGILVNGKLANSPSQAANFVTGTNVNGWTFWEACYPGQSGWTPIQALRPS